MNNTEYKTPNSIFTFGEIDEICKLMGWNHIKKYFQKYESQQPPHYWLNRIGAGYFIANNGKEYGTWSTMRGPSFEINPNRKDYEQRKKEIYDWLTSKEPTGMVQRWYAGPPREYYFFDITLENPWIYDSKEMAKLRNEDVEKCDKTNDGEKMYHLILYHLGIGKDSGEVWEHKKKENL